MQITQFNSLHWLSNLEIPLANKFYRKQGFRGKAKRNELCAVVKTSQNAIIASAYLREFGGFDVQSDGQSENHTTTDKRFSLLAGVAVAPEHQGRGVARFLLQQMSKRFDAQTYTFPYENLVPFYLSLGFKLVQLDLQETPSSDFSIGRLYQTYRNQGRLISVMVYQEGV